jgi:uncharacterized protein (UPF0276 family)
MNARIEPRAGIGLRAVHHAEVIERRPDVGWLEVHSENYFARGGAPRNALARARELYPISLHGVGLSLGSCDPLNREHLATLARLIRDFDPALVSEHLCWGSVDGRFTNDLLPLPYTEEAVRHLTQRVGQAQNELGRRLLIENVSSYLQFAESQMSEWGFLDLLAQESGCAILLDVNNIHVSAMNHGFDALEYIQGIARGAVAEIHLAGHSIETIAGREIRIDTHGAVVCDAVWELYGAALRRFGPQPTLIEWDTDIPALDVLVCEAHKADKFLEAQNARAA